jgi:hypothetical protein
LEDLGLDGKIVLNLILKSLDGDDFFWLIYGTVMGSSQLVNEPLDSMKVHAFHE